MNKAWSVIYTNSISLQLFVYNFKKSFSQIHLLCRIARTRITAKSLCILFLFLVCVVFFSSVHLHIGMDSMFSNPCLSFHFEFLKSCFAKFMLQYSPLIHVNFYFFLLYSYRFVIHFFLNLRHKGEFNCATLKRMQYKYKLFEFNAACGCVVTTIAAPLHEKKKKT